MQLRAPAKPARHKQASAVGSEAGRSPSSGASPAVAPVEDGSAGFALLLRIEQLARIAADLPELRHLMANETRKLNRARQVFVVDVGTRGRVEVATVTGIAKPDSEAALIRDVCRLLREFARQAGLEREQDFTLPAYCEPDSDLASTYPFRAMAWVPMRDRKGVVFAGMLVAREQAWTKDELAVSVRLAECYAHAWRELATARHFKRRRLRELRWKGLVVTAVLAAMLWPVPMTALAPVEIVAADPVAITAPIDGVVESLAVDPSTPVRAGDLLLRLADTVLRNRVEIARREVAVAEARMKQSNILAFGDPRGRHELGIAQVELDLKKAELALATDQLARTEIRAPRSGIAIYADRRSLVGKPVATGERIMEIADPARVEARIDLAVPDAIALTHESRVKLFLDVDPLRPVHGKVERSDYLARPSDTDVLSFRTFARLDDGAFEKPPRIGLRGTAQVQGDPVPLGVFLFRRPISAVRQWLGL